MKKILIFLCLLISFQLSAQKKPDISKVAARSDKMIAGLTFDNWLDLPAGVETDMFRSRGFDLLIMNEKMNTAGTFGLGYGFGFNSQNVHSNAYIYDSTDKSFTGLVPIPDSVSYDLNKLSLNYLNLALELRLRSKPNEKGKSFKFSAGIKGGLLLQSHTKYKDDDGKFKSHGIHNLNDFQYGLTARLAYGKWGIGGYYSLAGIFKDKKGPELIPYSVGIYTTL